jgi:prevent-host-death family protein
VFPGERIGQILGYYGVMQTVSVSEAKDKLSTLIESVESTHDAVVITRHGKPAAVLISPDDLDSLHETLVWLSDPNHAAEMAEAEEDLATGRTLSLEEVRAQLANR